MTDYLLRATAANHSVRIFVATTKQLVQKAADLHHTTPVASAALGRTLTAGCIMGAMLKGEKDLVTLHIKGEGPLRGVMVTADSQSHVKGYVYNPQAELPLNAVGKLDVGGAIGPGTLRIIRDVGMGDPYVGQIELVSGEIAEDLTYYFATSEQVPTAIALGVLVDRDYSIRQAGGIMIQLMPDATEETISMIEQKLQALSSVTSLFEEGHTPEEILKIILGDLDYSILERRDLSFQCNCSKERVEKALISLGRQELEDMIHEGKEIDLHCHFCNCHYPFTVDELESLYKAARS
ncbi:MAG: Hsp33 family molecular chaperone HslO [Epulopiscium sp.]|nr:Hsp33 family molecular chaperone HslO [Candidatus Epulonipiscium sp.]